MSRSNTFKEERVSPLGMWTFADSYYQCYKICSEHGRINYILVQYFLLCHALELGLKSILRAHQWSIPQLEDLRHDLVKTAMAVEWEVRFHFSEDEKATIRMANVHYKSKELEYHARGTKSFPGADQLANLTTKVLDNAKQLAEESKAKEAI